MREDVPEFSRLHEVARFAQSFDGAEAVQLVADLRQEENRGRVAIRRAGDWLAAF